MPEKVAPLWSPRAALLISAACQSANLRSKEASRCEGRQMMKWACVKLDPKAVDVMSVWFPLFELAKIHNSLTHRHTYLKALHEQCPVEANLGVLRGVPALRAHLVNLCKFSFGLFRTTILINPNSPAKHESVPHYNKQKPREYVRPRFVLPKFTQSQRLPGPRCPRTSHAQTNVALSSNLSSALSLLVRCSNWLKRARSVGAVIRLLLFR